MFRAFLWCTRYNLECLTMNNNYQAIQTHHFTLMLLFEFYCFCTVVLYFSTCNKYTSFEKQHVYWNLLNPISVKKQEHVCVVHLFCCFLCSWISFPCFYLDNNCLTSLFIASSAKSSLCFMTESISSSKLLSASIGRSKQKVFGSVVITSLLFTMYTPIIIMTWLISCKLFW